jgi:hypothetical protein
MPLTAIQPRPQDARGARAIPVEAGWQFGSRYPRDPARTAVYDFLPDALLSQVVNLEDFRATPVFDKRVSNADGRRSVFYRALVRGAGQTGKPGFVARMIRPRIHLERPQLGFPRFTPSGPLRSPAGL